MPTSLPVLLYHGISDFEDPLHVSTARFDEHLSTLTSKGYRSVNLDEAIGHFTGEAPLPPRCVLITFDDGFLDNWVNAYPLLARHGHKATIFAVAERIEQSGVRPNLADVEAGRADMASLPDVVTPFDEDDLGFRVRRAQFISWDEARIMEASDTVSVACHSLTHESVFCSPEWDAIVRPWHRKRVFDVATGARVWGMPRFHTAPALTTRAFLPSENVFDVARRMVPQQREEAAEFLKDENVIKELGRRFAAIAPEDRGRLETEEEFRNRVRLDLEKAKRMLERELGRPERALCWPWGKCSPEARGIAQALGFTALFTTEPGANLPGDPTSIHRFKARNNAGSWLASRLFIYGHPLAARLYSLIKA